jgi:hypothetical protein
MKLILAIRPPMKSPLAKEGETNRPPAAVIASKSSQFKRPILSREKYSTAWDKPQILL